MRLSIRALWSVVLIASLVILPQVSAPATAQALEGGLAADVFGPDQPETLSFNPNSIKDLEAAEPGAGINLIDVPEPSSTGDVLLGYPLEVPAGRNGVEPELEVSYNSSAANGWMGLGWDLALPAITIDTRWGVPRYSADQETETYLLDGRQLTPVAHRGAPQARTADKVFHTRVEGAFQKIIRHGTGPANYWWELIEKDGTRSFYGGGPETRGPAADSTLVDDGGNVFRWALREVRRNENSMRYSYTRVADVGVAGGTVPGVQLYPATINYTRFDNATGAYTVSFIRDRELPGYTRRHDVTIDARGGFKMVTADLLKRVTITFEDQLVRAYDFVYREGAFKKTLLQSVVQRGENGEVFHTHAFTYYEDPTDFDTARDWNTVDDDVTAGLLDQGRASALSGSISDSIGGHAYVGFNLLNGTKNGSAGGKVGFQYDNNEGVLQLLDINGDSLPDKVFCSDWEQGSFTCRRFAFRLNRSGPAGTTTFSEQAYPIDDLPAISTERSITASFGGEAYFGANVFLNQAETFTTGTAYFGDANGDGLPDLVKNGRIYFNHLANGVPTFTPDDSSRSPVPIGSGTVSGDGLIENYDAIYGQQVAAFPLHDTLRRWVAPFTGKLQIRGTVALREDTSQARRNYATADGVRVAIQHKGSELWSARIEADDYSAKTPTGVGAIAVRQGDAIYFRVQSIFDGAYDQVAWDPELVYLDVTPATDVNGLNPYRYRASEDFVLAGRRDMHVQMPLAGTVRLAGELNKRGVTTDDVTLLVLKNGVPVFSRTIAWNATGAIDPAQDIAVAKDDRIQLRVQVDSPIDPRQLAWSPRLFYTATPDPDQRIVDQQGNPLFQLHPPYDIDLYPANQLGAPQAAWTAPQTGALTVVPQLVGLAGDANGSVSITVKRQGGLLAKHSIAVRNGSVDNRSFVVDVTQGERLFFDYAAYDPRLADKLGTRTVVVAYGDPDDAGVAKIAVPSAFHSAAVQDLFGQPYRGWAYAGYNGNGARATAPIQEHLLRLPTDDLRRDCAANPADPDRPPTDCNPSSGPAYAFSPFAAEGSWRGSDELGWVKGDTMSSSRLGLDYVDVPRPGQFAGARAVNRLSRTSQTVVGGGASLLSGSISGQDPPFVGKSYAAVDYLDMNGDSFPDVVGNGRVQYTTPTGGLEADNREIAGLGHVRESKETAWNFGIGGSPVKFQANSQGKVNGQGKPRGNTTGGQMVEMGMSGGLGKGDSDTRSELLDVNGDSLPDRVSRDGDRLMVALNLGYRFAAAEPWGTAVVEDGASRTLSVGAALGFNGGIYDFAGGLSLDRTDSHAACETLPWDPADTSCDNAGQALLDLNGDGLLDRVSPDGARLRVAINTGNGFAPEIAWNGALADAVASNSTVGLGAGVYFTIGIGPLCLPTNLCYIIINPGVDGSESMARQETELVDVDGDGYVDHVRSTADGRMTVARNRTGRTNLLRSIARPLGATIDLEYQRDGNTYDTPQSRWLLSRVATFDGHAGDGADRKVTDYRYEHGVYDRFEREFYGYAKVVGHQLDTTQANTVYRTVVGEYFNDSFATKGLLKRERVLDAAGRPFVELVHTYALRDVATGAEPAPGRMATATIFPQLLRTDQHFFEGHPAPAKSTYTTFQYDALGNLTQSLDAGDSGAADDRLETVTYSDRDAACAANYVVGLPMQTVVTADGRMLRRTEATVDCERANVLQTRRYLADGDAATTDFAYFADDNLKSVIGPANLRGQRYRLDYSYDPMVATFLTGITDSFGYRSTATYDLKHGDLATATDLNNNTTSFAYDVFGRLASITGPYQQGGTTPTIQFDYHPEAAVPWARSRHLDTGTQPAAGPANTLDVVVFVDGLERTIQTKHDGTVHSGPDSAPQDVMLVSGRVAFDFAGRGVEEFYPLTEPMGTPGVFNAAFDTVKPSRVTYDVLDRITSHTIPDDTRTSWAFGFGQDRAGATQLETTITDGRGVQRKQYRNVRDLIVSVAELNDGGRQVSWTSYSYDPLDQIIGVADDRNNTTTVAYDSLGRRTVVDSPDAGRTELRYDQASNVVARITGNLRAAGTQIAYGYDFNRLATITYPRFAGNNVGYSYGAPGAADNRAGRITRVTDESGATERFYGRLGELTKEIKTIAGSRPESSAAAPAVYTSQYVYDTFGRLQTLVYPDGEVLTYRYDSGGRVRQAVGQKAGDSYTYINRLEYDKFGEDAFAEMGNGVRTSYSYDPRARELVNVRSGRGNGAPFQNLRYAYDPAGNVIGAANDVAVPKASEYGGPTSQTFVYDDLSRLVSAAGTYQFKADTTRRYRVSFAYNTIHDIVAKQQADEIVKRSGNATPQHKTSYAQTYSYGGAQPHAPDHIGERTFSYDANGNQLGWTHDGNGTRRTIVWDEENRIQSLFDNGHEKTYAYNDNGQRVIKRGPQGETVYVNPYFTIRNGANGTKHVFVAGTRLVSKLMQEGEAGSPPREHKQYFFHPDMLGSSNFVTDADGKLFEHLEYFPSGETWLEESSNTQRTPYLFTGKELDEETGLYYFGARYYDPQTSGWLSGDPILGLYVDGLPNRGVYHPANLNLYAYGYQNPTTYVDPDGNANGKHKKVSSPSAKKKAALLKPKQTAKFKPSAKKAKVPVITVSKSQYPETAQHIEDAIKGGHPDVVTINRTTAKQNRRDSLRGIPTKKGTDRDEYPMAMFAEGGTGASVRRISPSDNRGAGSNMAAQMRPYPNGTRVWVKVIK